MNDILGFGGNNNGGYYNNSGYNNPKFITAIEDDTTLDELYENPKCELEYNKDYFFTNRMWILMVEYDEAKMACKFLRLPEREEILPDIKENLIVEFYNR